MPNLCDIPPDQVSGACAPMTPAPAAPVRPTNPPGLTRIRYRIGTFPTFRQAMLDDLLAWMPALRVATEAPDYATTLVELWAYIADILTFYQEQIANEAFIETASQRNSLLHLAQLIAYRPRPGASASTLVSFTLALGKALTIPQGFRTGSKPARGQPGVTFETDAAIAARAEHNRIQLAASGPANQFAPLSSIASVFATPLPAFATRSELDQFRKDLGTVFPALGDDLFQSIGLQSQDGGAVGGQSGGATPLIKTPASRIVAFQGVNLKLRPGDYLLIFDRFASSGNPHGDGWLREIKSVDEDRPARTTYITWTEQAGDPNYESAQPLVFAFRAKASPFGSSAPDYRLISPFLTAKANVTALNTTPFTQLNVLFHSDWGLAKLPDTTDASVLDLDRVYEGIVPSAVGADSWVVLYDPTGSDTKAVSHQVCRIVAANQVTRTDYMITARVSELRLDRKIRPGVFSLRSTIVLLHSEALTLAQQRRLPEPVGGATLILDGTYSSLTPGQAIIVTGKRYDQVSGAAAADSTAQDAVIEDLPRSVATPLGAMTIIALREPLKAIFARSTTTVVANVAPASHGETVRDEVLGSGNGAAWQRFTLRKSPLTYVQAATSETGVASTLQVTVNGVRWAEQPELADAGPQDRVFVINQDESNKTNVLFGDGATGARPSTGRDSIHARYRYGLGISGNVAAASILRLVDSLPGLQAVTNPQPALGGADPESDGAVRSNAPASLRTFGRAVAVDDYAALALTFPGVVRARAAWVRIDDAGKILAHPAIYVIVGLTNGTLAEQTDFAARLRRFLDSHRDPNVPMRLVDAARVYVDVAAVIDVDDAFGRHATLTAAQAALNPGANPDGTTGFFGRLDFGEAVHLSAVYAALQAVPGVRAATITALRMPQADPPGMVRDHIFVKPSSIAFVADDPADASNALGKLTISLGVGGFAD